MTSTTDIELTSVHSVNGQSATYATSRPDLPTVNNSAKGGSVHAGDDPSQEFDERELFISVLPPVDRGREAWSFLISATLIETLVWGLPFSIGILHAYWSSNMFSDSGSESTLTLAATLQTGLMYLTAAFLGPVFTAFPRYQRHIQLFGLAVSTASLIASAFVTKPWHLVVTIGCFYPFAGALYLPCATLLFEWFQSRRGLATGIMFAGTGAGGTVFPFIVSALLDHLGYKITMIAIGVGFCILNGTAFLFIKRRIPIGRYNPQGNIDRRRPRIDWSFAKRRAIWTGIVVILLTSMANFIPSLWIPSYAEAVNVTKPNGTVLVSLMNAASVPGNTLTGYISDRFSLRITILVSCLLATFSCLVLWGLGTSDGLLVAFSLIWGFTALSFVGLWSKMITTICRDDPTLPALMFSVFAMLKGVGSLTSGPISTSLLKVGSMRGSAGAYGSSNYGVLIIYTASATLLGGLSGLLFPEK